MMDAETQNLFGGKSSCRLSSSLLKKLKKKPQLLFIERFPRAGRG